MKKFIVMLLLLVFVLGTAVAEVLFYDDFSDGNADDWFEDPTGAVYEVVGQQYCQTLGHKIEDGMWAASFNADLGSYMSTPDYSILVEVTIYDGASWVAVRFSYDDWTGYGLRVKPASNEISICRFDYPHSPSETLGSEYMGLSYGNPYWIRMEVDGSEIMTKVWTGTVYDEPEEWLISATDTNYDNSGRIALGSSAGDFGTFHTEYNIVEVTDTGSTALERSTWGEIKTSGTGI